MDDDPRARHSDAWPEANPQVPSTATMLQVVGWAVAAVSVLGTAVICSDLSERGFGDDVPSSVTWSAIIDGLVPIGIGLLIVAAGLVVKRLDRR